MKPQTTKKGTIRFFALPMITTLIQIERWKSVSGTPGRVLDDLVAHALATKFRPRRRT